MSRRIFDVGLDMRKSLKHNKEEKERKRSKSRRSSHSKDNTDITPLPHLDQPIAPAPQIKHKKSSPAMSPQPNGHRRNQSSDPLVLPSPSYQEDSSSAFPLPPPNRSSPTPAVDGNEERPLHSSQLDPPNGTNGSPQPVPKRYSEGEQNSFDLKPPPPNSKVRNIDTLSEQLFSGEHLHVILKDPSFFLRFTAFLNRYKPHSAPVLVRYLEAQKAAKAVEYANALAETIKPAPGEHSSPCPAASLDPRFEAHSRRAFDSLVNEALPSYVTNSLTKVVTESMVREITGSGIPVFRELVGGMAEVFCLADPSIKDCPIVYASEEFYRTTRYSRDDVLGRNCRFLQGPKTDRPTVARLSAAIKSSQEICETILNYRRDGTPFMNLLLTAPLYDNRGSVRYFIGAQVDVSGLVEDGRGLDSFAQLLSESRTNKNRESDQSDSTIPQKHLRVLNELSQILSLDEASQFQKQHSRTSSIDNSSSVYRSTPTRPDRSLRQPRRVLGHEEEGGERRDDWALSSIGPSGKLPGVYQNYLLIRPHPSLRIIFLSPALRIPGLLQSPFLTHIGGPQHVRTGLSEAFESGAAVTAKVTWLPNGRGNEDHGGQKTRYISCTPLLGSDDCVGVWMVVMVENEVVTGSLASRGTGVAVGERWQYQTDGMPYTESEYQGESNHLVDGEGRSTGGGQGSARFPRTDSAHQRRGGKVGSEGGALYAEFMRNGNIGKTTVNDDYMTGEHVNGVSGATDQESRIQEIRSP